MKSASSQHGGTEARRRQIFLETNDVLERGAAEISVDVAPRAPGMKNKRETRTAQVVFLSLSGRGGTEKTDFSHETNDVLQRGAAEISVDFAPEAHNSKGKAGGKNQKLEIAVFLSPAFPFELCGPLAAHEVDANPQRSRVCLCVSAPASTILCILRAFVPSCLRASCLRVPVLQTTCLRHTCRGINWVTGGAAG